ncbi:hypothetical protein JNK13_02355 [bacterium]|nr:hypothetical protein [bacterium]
MKTYKLKYFLIYLIFYILVACSHQIIVTDETTRAKFDVERGSVPYLAPFSPNDFEDFKVKWQNGDQTVARWITDYHITNTKDKKEILNWLIECSNKAVKSCQEKLKTEFPKEYINWRKKYLNTN